MQIVQLESELGSATAQVVQASAGLGTSHLTESSLTLKLQTAQSDLAATQADLRALRGQHSATSQRCKATTDLVARMEQAQNQLTQERDQLQTALAKIQGEHLEVTVAELRQQLSTATAAAEQAAAHVAAKDASLDEGSACLTKARQDAQQVNARR